MDEKLIEQNIQIEKVKNRFLKKIIVIFIFIALMTLLLIIKPNAQSLKPIFYGTAVALFVILLISAVKLFLPFTDAKTVDKYYQASDYLFVLVSACFVFQIVFSFLFFTATVDGDSMFPKLHNSDRLIVTVRYSDVDNFTVVVAKCNEQQANYSQYSNLSENDLLVKRVIGKPGDTFYYEDNVLILNGTPYEEPYLESTHTSSFSLDNFKDKEGIEYDEENEVYRISEGYYFLMGDNRTYSVDSRRLGLFKEEQLIGIVKYRFSGLFNWEVIE